jgi:glyoxalase family protein
MIHTIALGVGSVAALPFWAKRLREGGFESELTGETLSFSDYDGLALELVVAAPGNPPLVAEHPEVPAPHAIVGVQGARAYGAGPSGATELLTASLGFTAQGGSEYRLIGEHRQFAWAYDAPPPERGRQGAGSVHHIAWASRDEDHLAWQRRVREAGPIVTEVLDRQYFKSIYFREPRGILFEIATLSPGFAVDEDPDHLGEELELPEMHEQLRPQLVRRLTPIVNPRVRRRQAPEP